MVGVELAKFYLELGQVLKNDWKKECIETKFFQVQKANTFLVDALKTFENEGWSLLKVQTLTDTAKCYEKLNDWEKLLRTCAQIACADQLVSPEQKLQYCEKFKDIAGQYIGKFFVCFYERCKGLDYISYSQVLSHLTF